MVKNEDKIAYLSKIRLKDVIYGKHQFEIELSAIGQRIIMVTNNSKLQFRLSVDLYSSFLSSTLVIFSQPYLVPLRLCYSVSSVVCLYGMYCDKRCVLEQKLLLTTYTKSYMRNQLVPKLMTLIFVQRSYQGHVNHCLTASDLAPSTQINNI